MKIRLLGALAGVAAAAVAVASACGGGSSEPTATPQATTPTLQEIKVTALENGPQYAFDQSEIKVKPGTIRVTFTNNGSERPHTFNVKNRNGEGELVKSERANVGSSLTLEFTIAEEGRYEYLCLLPGHADRGQRGTLIVSRS